MVACGDAYSSGGLGLPASLSATVRVALAPTVPFHSRWRPSTAVWKQQSRHDSLFVQSRRCPSQTQLVLTHLIYCFLAVARDDDSPGSSASSILLLIRLHVSGRGRTPGFLGTEDLSRAGQRIPVLFEISG